MTRGPEIAVLVDDLWKILGKKKQADGEAPCVLRRTFDFLRSLPDYTEHLRAPTSDDFAYLPAEIIHDVLDANECVLELSLTCLVDVEGLWGYLSLERMERIRIKFKSNAFLRQLCHYKFQPVTFEEARDHSIYSSEIDESSDFEQLRAVAPNLYESIEFTDVPHIPDDIIMRIGNRFSSVTWLIEENTPDEEDENEKPTENYMKPQVADFLKRQLRSKYLRKLEIAGLGLKQGELDNLLVDFVKRPHFESLNFYESADKYWTRNPGGYALSFDVIKEAHISWISRDYFDVDRQGILGVISRETREQLKEYFQTNFFGYYQVKHSSLPDVTLSMRIYEKNDQKLEFSLWSGTTSTPRQKRQPGRRLSASQLRL